MWFCIILVRPSPAALLVYQGYEKKMKQTGEKYPETISKGKEEEGNNIQSCDGNSLKVAPITKN